MPCSASPRARAGARHRLRLLAVLALACAARGAAAQGWEAGRYEVEGRRSGYLYMDAASRALQDDDFLNSGFFAVERGAGLWTRVEGAAGRSCASCHGDAAASMRGVAARYPVWDAGRGGLVNLEMRINEMRQERMKAAEYPYESEDLLALTTYLSYQSRGMPVAVAIDGPAAPFFARGREEYFRPRGQLDLACTDCHDRNAGQRLRGDVISQGQQNGFPIYRLMWRGMGSRHRMFAWCNWAVRAEPSPPGTEDYLALELYLAWRGRGLPIETPAVRR